MANPQGGPSSCRVPAASGLKTRIAEPAKWVFTEKGAIWIAVDGVGIVNQPDSDADVAFRFTEGIRADAREGPDEGTESEVDSRDGLVFRAEEIGAQTYDERFTGDKLKGVVAGATVPDLERRYGKRR